MYLLTVKTHIDAAHRIQNYKGKCSCLHGHRWDIEVALEGSVLDDRNILVDFVDVKKAINAMIDRPLDHAYLNEVFEEPNLTAEFLAQQIFKSMQACPIPNVALVRVTVWESPECSVTYCERS